MTRFNRSRLIVELIRFPVQDILHEPSSLSHNHHPLACAAQSKSTFRSAYHPRGSIVIQIIKLLCDRKEWADYQGRG